MKPIIVGGSAVGNYLALKLAEAGMQPLVLEEHTKIGEPLHCTGIVSTNLKKVMQIPEDLIKNRIKGARIHCNDQEFTAGDKETRAYVLDRAGYDKYLYELAVNQGAVYKLGTKYYSHIKMSNHLEVSTSEGVISTSVLVGADGVNSKIAHSIGIKNNYIVGYQYTCELEHDLDFVDIFVGMDYAPEFFAWVVPEAENICRVGLAGKFTKDKIDRFSKDIGVKNVISKQAGLIPLCYNKRTSSDNLLLVGDAAGHVKATTGGGIIYGSLCARIAAKAITKAVITNSFSGDFFKDNYDKIWQKLYGKELKKHFLLRKLMNSLNTEDYKMLLSFAKSNSDLFETKGDMDFVSNLLSSISRKSEIFTFGIRKLPLLLSNLGLII